MNDQPSENEGQFPPLYFPSANDDTATSYDEGGARRDIMLWPYPHDAHYGLQQDYLAMLFPLSHVMVHDYSLLGGDTVGATAEMASHSSEPLVGITDTGDNFPMISQGDVNGDVPAQHFSEGEASLYDDRLNPGPEARFFPGFSFWGPSDISNSLPVPHVYDIGAASTQMANPILAQVDTTAGTQGMAGEGAGLEEGGVVAERHSPVSRPSLTLTIPTPSGRGVETDFADDASTHTTASNLSWMSEIGMDIASSAHSDPVDSSNNLQPSLSRVIGTQPPAGRPTHIICPLEDCRMEMGTSHVDMRIHVTSHCLSALVHRLRAQTLSGGHTLIENMETAVLSCPTSHRPGRRYRYKTPARWADHLYKEHRGN